ncbi:MAG: MarR family transcriptional regulator [Proteobacteria bacterium]|nr:MarR family transcriptional regulator [Pseudomonadota bacterium]
MSDGYDNLGFLLCDTARLLRRRFDSRVRDLGLTRSQWQVLAHISRQEGMHQAALADKLEIEPITLTRLLERMEKGGWVLRRADKADKRVRCVYLTAKARPVLLKLRALGQKVLAEALRGIPASMQRQLREALLGMNENLSGMSVNSAMENGVRA